MEESSDWRDWANHPVAVTAVWPRVLASGMPPASCLALLGTCLRTRNAVLYGAPRAKLAVWLGPDQPAPDPLSLLNLLQQNSRTQPTTLALLNSTSTRQPSTAQTRLTPHAASTSAQHILSHPACAGSSCITRLTLQGIEVNPPLLQAMQHLPALTHLHLSHATLPATGATHQPAILPQSVHTLYIDVRTPEAAPFVSLLTELIMPDTLTNLTVTGRCFDFTMDAGEEANMDRACVTALESVSGRGGQALALRKLYMPRGHLISSDIETIQRGAPLLEELQVSRIDPMNGYYGEIQVSWHTLIVHQLDIRDCCHLPLGGTEPLDIQVSGNLFVGCGGWGGDDLLLGAISHLTSQQIQPVRLVGTGKGGGAFTWVSARQEDGTDLAIELSALRLSKAPVHTLSIRTETAIDVDQLLVALQSLPALTQLNLVSVSWHGATTTNTHDQLLAQLPVHVEQVRLETDFGGYTEALALFQRMAAAASTVPGRQAHPLRLCIPGACQRWSIWKAVDGFRARGAMGVVMEENWN